MKEIKKTKFTLEKFEVAKLKKPQLVIGGTGVGNDPDTGTLTSQNCSNKPGCRSIVGAPAPAPPGLNH